jgi:CRISPR-associated protein Cmr6
VAYLRKALREKGLTMARIPIAGDVAELIGPAAEKVENRSLLLDKFAFHKRWPIVADARGREIKWDDASRWSFTRIADGAAQLLGREALAKRNRAGGQNVEPENRERLLAESKIAESLADVCWDSKELSALRARHTRRFLGLFRSAYGDRASVTIGQLEGRLAINLADSLIQNAGICLDRLFGLPYLPGSAVKGVCRHAALEELQSAPPSVQPASFDAFRAAFGTADNDFTNGDLARYRLLLAGRPENKRGNISFLPAYPVNEAKVVVDLTNVHYPEYYRTGRTEDLAKERPQPNAFPVVEVGAQFAFCLVLNRTDADRALLAHAKRWLETAVTARGLGAKTSAGYGWFSTRPEVLNEIEKEERRERESVAAAVRAEAEAKLKADAEAARRAAMSPEQEALERFSGLSPEEFAKAASGVAALTAAEQRGMLLALSSPAKRDTWKAWKKSDKPANKARVDALNAAAKAHGITLR